MSTVRVHLRREYGNRRFYLAHDAPSQAVATLTGRATLSAQDMEALSALGVRVVEE